jgi:hypothetical protein
MADKVLSQSKKMRSKLVQRVSSMQSPDDYTRSIVARAAWFVNPVLEHLPARKRTFYTKFMELLGGFPLMICAQVRRELQIDVWCEQL